MPCLVWLPVVEARRGRAVSLHLVVSGRPISGAGHQGATSAIVLGACRSLELCRQQLTGLAGLTAARLHSCLSLNRDAEVLAEVLRKPMTASFRYNTPEIRSHSPHDSGERATQSERRGNG